MGWTAIFKRQASRVDRTASPPAADAVQQARTRARRRLIGAFVLVVIGVIGFPLLFESQPRPVPVDIPIDVPRRDAVVPLPSPAKMVAPARRAQPVVVEASSPAASSVPMTSAPAITTPSASNSSAGGAAQASPPTDAASAIDGRQSEPRVAAASAPAAAPAPASTAARTPSKPAAPVPAPREAARASTPPESSKPAAQTAPKDQRFVVQAGAFSDQQSARETRQKLERLGLKTYTQAAETSSGKRVRVRAGPYATREEAEKALAKARAAGLTAVVLTL